MAGLLGKYPTPLLPLGIVDGQTPLPTLHEDHETDNSNRQNTNSENNQQAHFTVTSLLQSLANGARKTGNNTREDQQRNTVTNTSFGDLLTEPHHEDRTADKRHNRHKVEAEAVIKGNAL